MDAIWTEALTKHYRVGFWRPRPYLALDSLTLYVREGEVFGFLGPNGAGKTTTLKLLMQLIYPSSGRAEILGRPVGDVSVKRRLGYLPENPYFYDYLTAEELLQYFAGLFGFSAAERRRRVSRLLDDVGIGAERRLQLRKFSKGMLQRVGIAQAIINDPEVVFFDEPMSGLDPLGRREVRELILRLRDRGLHGLLQFSRAFRRGNALQPRGHSGRRAACGGGGLVRNPGLPGAAWELVVTGLSDTVLEKATASGQVVRATSLGAQRYALEVPLSAAPDRIAADLVAHGAQLVSINPVRETLEDFFVREIGAAPPDRRLDPAAP